jgi:hypothetical protein
LRNQENDGTFVRFKLGDPIQVEDPGTGEKPWGESDITFGKEREGRSPPVMAGSQ